MRLLTLSRYKAKSRSAELLNRRRRRHHSNSLPVACRQRTRTRKSNIASSSVETALVKVAPRLVPRAKDVQQPLSRQPQPPLARSA